VPTKRAANLTASVSTFPRSYFPLLTDEVKSASAAHDDALRRLAEAKRTAAGLLEAVDEAHVADAADARAAAAAGKSPGARTAPAAIEAADRAQRAVDAGVELARSSQGALLDSVVADLDPIHSLIEDRREAIAAASAGALAQVEGALREAGALAELAAALDPVLLTGAHPQFAAAQRRRRPYDHAAEPLRTVRAVLGEPYIDDAAAAA